MIDAKVLRNVLSAERIRKEHDAHRRYSMAEQDMRQVIHGIGGFLFSGIALILEELTKPREPNGSGRPDLPILGELLDNLANRTNNYIELWAMPQSTALADLVITSIKTHLNEYSALERIPDGVSIVFEVRAKDEVSDLIYEDVGITSGKYFCETAKEHFNETDFKISVDRDGTAANGAGIVTMSISIII